MPKIHDSCQLLLEESLHKTRSLPPVKAVYAMTICLHALEEDLHDRHPDAKEIAAHLWLVWERDIAPRFPPSAFLVPEGEPPLADDDYTLGTLIQATIWDGRRFFPYKKAII